MWLRELIFVIFLFVFSYQNIGQENYTIFDNANNLYENKLYDSAKNTYLKLYNKGRFKFIFRFKFTIDNRSLTRRTSVRSLFNYKVIKL